MYNPAHFEEKDVATMHALMREHPLATWVTMGAGGLTADHMPFMVDPSRGPCGTLICHVARANPVWKSLVSGTPSLVIFQGANSYITPSWYATKKEHGKVVPTWNYATVHAHGVATAIEEKAQLLALVTRLTNTHERSSTQPWQVSDAPSDYINTLLGAIVGIEMPISTLQGKWKVSQNQPKANLAGVLSGLAARGAPDDAAMASMIQNKAPRSS